MAAAPDQQVAGMLKSLEKKLDDLNNKIEAALETKSHLERNVIKYEDEMIEIEEMLVKQRRLHKQYGVNIAEAETALNTLAISTERFASEVDKVARVTGR